MRKIQRYGWHPDLPDGRDLLRAVNPTALPSSVDLSKSPHMPPVYDQGQLGSCTANGIGACVEFVNHAATGKFVQPSRLFIYYNERALEGTVGSDCGAQIRDGIKVVAAQGACPETDWPYDISRFTVKPSQNCYTDALRDLITKYESVPQDETALKTVLAGGEPVVFGITVFSSFETFDAATSPAPLPSLTDSCIGGHCVVLVGYDDARQCWLVRNSWGPGWGIGGYFWLPYAYTDPRNNLARDCWVITKASPA